MELTKAIELIRPAEPRFTSESSWADLGCGTGLFTRALSEMLTEGCKVYAVDKDQRALNSLKNFKNVNLKKVIADFSRDTLPFTGLDGILMANSLHFVFDKSAFLARCHQWLKHNGCFLLIEYDTDEPNPWVPYPLSFLSAEKLFQQSGYRVAKKLGSQPSLYNRSNIYSALLER